MRRYGELAVIETHPIQYHAPIYRTLQAQFNIRVTAIYGSDFSVAGYRDKDFGASFAWDTDLLSGYTSIFLSQSTAGGARLAEEVTGWGLDTTLKQVSPKVVLLTGYSPRFHQQAIWHSWRGDYPIIFRGETTDVAHRRSLLRGLLRDLLLQLFYGRCRKLLFVGRASYEHYRRLGCPKSKLIFSPYCVNTAPFQTAEPERERLRGPTRRDMNLPDSGIAILFSGKLVIRKAPDLLLRAVKALPDSIRARIVIVYLGSGELLESLEEIARTTPFSEVRFLGFQNQTALSRYYHAADLMVLPSHIGETWGLVVNEALHHGLPCVVSDRVGCGPDLIEPGVTGEFFEAASVESLALALQRALGLISLLTTREHCRAKASGYTVEQAAAGIATAYRAVVNYRRED